MSRYLPSLALLCIAVVTQSINSCVHQENPELTAAKAQLLDVQTKQAQYNYAANSYEHFVSHNQYPVTINIFQNKELMAKAGQKCRVVICLSQQRGRLYVDGQVAADWPVSTGIPGRDTPTGHFSIIGKKESYASNRYGKMYDSEGKCINSDADAFTQEVPEGGSFVGSPMPYWMRLTGDGVGMHVGKVQAGKRLSHGCIRTPRTMAKELFRVTKIGTKVDIVKEIEPEYPARDALTAGKSQNELERRARQLQQKIYQLQQQEILEREG